MTARPLLLRQASVVDGFTYEFLDETGVVGGVHFATFSQARNARLKWHAAGSRRGDIALELCGRRAHVCFEYLRRGLRSDIRYTLEAVDGAESATLASADVLFTDTQAKPRILMNVPVQAEVMQADRMFGKTFRIVGPAGSLLGQVREPNAFSLRRELQVDLRGVEPMPRAFVAIVVLCVRY